MEPIVIYDELVHQIKDVWNAVMVGLSFTWGCLGVPEYEETITALFNFLSH